MKTKTLNTPKIEKDIHNETAELNGVKVDAKEFETPRSTFEMLEQTCQIA